MASRSNSTIIAVTSMLALGLADMPGTFRTCGAAQGADDAPKKVRLTDANAEYNNGIDEEHLVQEQRWTYWMHDRVRGVEDLPNVTNAAAKKYAELTIIDKLYKKIEQQTHVDLAETFGRVKMLREVLADLKNYSEVKVDLHLPNALKETQHKVEALQPGPDLGLPPGQMLDQYLRRTVIPTFEKLGAERSKYFQQSKKDKGSSWAGYQTNDALRSAQDCYEYLTEVADAYRDLAQVDSKESDISLHLDAYLFRLRIVLKQHGSEDEYIARHEALEASYNVLTEKLNHASP